MEKKTAFIFPGQGSQSVGMTARYGAHPQVAEAMAEASDALGEDLPSLCKVGADPEKLNQTINTQPALLAIEVGVYRAFREGGGGDPSVMAGHSLGEWSALVCAGALDFSAAIKLVRARAQAMQKAAPTSGLMAAALGKFSNEDAISICQEISEANSIVSAANFNAPGQVVLAGHEDAVLRAAELLKARGAKKIVQIAMSVPSHCELMSPAKEELRARLADEIFHSPQIPIIHNATLQAANSPLEIKDALAEQLCAPINWVGIINRLCDVAEIIAECGPGGVLTGLGKRIAPQMNHISLGDSDSLKRFLHNADSN